MLIHPLASHTSTHLSLQMNRHFNAYIILGSFSVITFFSIAILFIQNDATWQWPDVITKDTQPGTRAVDLNIITESYYILLYFFHLEYVQVLLWTFGRFVYIKRVACRTILCTTLFVSLGNRMSTCCVLMTSSLRDWKYDFNQKEKCSLICDRVPSEGKSCNTPNGCIVYVFIWLSMVNRWQF